LRFALAVAAFVVVLAVAIAGAVSMPSSSSPPIFRAAEGPPGYALRGDYASGDERERITLDAAGRRVTAPLVPNPGARVVHVIGGSAVFGVGLADEATIPSRLQADLGRSYRVVNDGVPGYGPYAYASRALSLPANDLAIVLFSEGDDLRALYSATSPNSVHCGCLIGQESLALRVPCNVLSPRIVRAVAALRATVLGTSAPLPLNYDSGSTFAARVLAARMKRLVDECKRHAAGHLIVSYVPWDGALEPAHLAHYAGGVREATSSVAFSDDADVAAALRRTAGERYADDGSLSPLGADVVARALASEVRRRAR
jgi:hypothetical protein